MTIPLGSFRLVYSRVDNYMFLLCKLYYTKAKRLFCKQQELSGALSLFSFLAGGTLQQMAACGCRLMADCACFETRCQALVQALHKNLTSKHTPVCLASDIYTGKTQLNFFSFWKFILSDKPLEQTLWDFIGKTYLKRNVLLSLSKTCRQICSL